MTGVNWLQQLIKPKKKQQEKDMDTLPLSAEQTKQDICGDQSEMNPLPDLKPLNIVRSIKDLPLKDFIECCCNNRYELLVKGDLEAYSEAQLKEVYEVWVNLLSQYYEVSGDEELQEQFRITIEMKAIEYQKSVMAVLEQTMLDSYNEDLAAVLREHYPKYTFSKETLEKDFEQAKKLDVKTRMRYDQLKSTLDSLINDTGKKAAKISQEESFYNTLFDINAVEKGAYTKDISTYEFALLRKRLIKHVEYLQSQSK